MNGDGLCNSRTALIHSATVVYSIESGPAEPLKRVHTSNIAYPLGLVLVWCCQMAVVDVQAHPRRLTPLTTWWLEAKLACLDHPSRTLPSSQVVPCVGGFPVESVPAILTVGPFGCFPFGFDRHNICSETTRVDRSWVGTPATSWRRTEPPFFWHSIATSLAA